MAAAAEGSLTGTTPEGDTLRVREVWEDNLEDEMQVCSAIVTGWLICPQCQRF